MSRSKLSIISGLGNDLPPKWDGQPVTWHGWNYEPTTLEYHLPVDQRACDQCGTVAYQPINAGSRLCPDHGHQIRDLFAFRCLHCKFDYVFDMRTNQSWDLDPSDYSDGGSYEIGQGELL